MPEDRTERPFLWSEIHSIAKDRVAQLDANIRTEIGRPKVSIPDKGADRSQFFLLLEEEANLWADRARDLHEACLKEIGRENSLSARSSVYHNSLSFFLSDNLRHFLYLKCGCVVERLYTVRKPGQPRTYMATEVPHDVGRLLTQIIGRVKSRIANEFTKTGNWLEDMQGILREMQPHTTELTRVTTAPLPSAPVPDPACLQKSEPPAKATAATQSGEAQPATRKELIERFRDRVLKEGGKRISKTDICRVAGYKSRRSLERWQRNDLKPCSDPDMRFTATLARSTDEFLERLDKIKASSKS